MEEKILKKDINVLSTLAENWEELSRAVSDLRRIEDALENETLVVIQDKLKKEKVKIEKIIKKLFDKIEITLEKDTFLNDKYLKQLKLLILNFIELNKTNVERHIYLRIPKLYSSKKRNVLYIHSYYDIERHIEIILSMYVNSVEDYEKNKGVA